MTLSSDSFAARLVEAAWIEAVASARWDRIDFQTRRPAIPTQHLLLAKAAELALSSVARDQLASLALERLGGTGDPMALADPEDAPWERGVIGKQVFAAAPRSASETDDLVRIIETRHSHRLRQDLRFDLLAECLVQDAILHEALWNHPDIPASTGVRLGMLCAVPKLHARAEELSPSDTFSIAHILRWFRSGFKEVRR